MFNLVIQRVLLELLAGIWVRGYLQVTYRNDSKTTASQMQPSMVTAHKLEHTSYRAAAQWIGACSFLVPQLVQTSSWRLSWFLLLPGSWPGLSLWSLCCSASLFLRGSALIAYSSREWLSESGQVQGLPEVSLSSLLSLRSYPAGCNVSISQETVKQYLASKNVPIEIVYINVLGWREGSAVKDKAHRKDKQY